MKYAIYALAIFSIMIMSACGLSERDVEATVVARFDSEFDKRVKHDVEATVVSRFNLRVESEVRKILSTPDSDMTKEDAINVIWRAMLKDCYESRDWIKAVNNRGLDSVFDAVYRRDEGKWEVMSLSPYYRMDNDIWLVQPGTGNIEIVSQNRNGEKC